MTTPSWKPSRTIEECNALMTAPGAMFEMEEVSINGLKLRAYKNLPKSLREFWLGTTVFGPLTYIVYQDERITYEEAFVRVAEIANLLSSKYGCVKGDKIGIASRNYPEYILTFWAIHLLGAVVVAVNAWTTPDVLEHCISFAECKIVFFDQQRAEMLHKAGGTKRVKDKGAEQLIVFRPETGGVPAGMQSFESCIKGFVGQTAIPDAEVYNEDIASIFYTSGTTGLPKGVVGTNRNFTNSIINSLNGAIRAALRRGEPWPAEVDPNALQRSVLLSVPLYHVTGCQAILGTYTAIAGKIVIMYKWDAKIAAELIVKERVTGAGGIPFVAMDLLNSSLSKTKHDLDTVSYGGGPASKELAFQIPKHLGKTTWPGQGYGTSELSSTAVNFQSEDYMLRPSSTGLPCLVMDTKIVSLQDGSELPAGQRGEILMRGPTRCLGYLKNPKATDEVFLKDGFYRTGDIGYLDEEGFLYILDRAKDIIIRGGENIASAVVENALFEEHRLADVAVTPIPDATFGELVGATVVTHPQYHGQLSEAALIAHVAKKLPKHMVPVFIDIRRDTLPRNGAGKTLKRELKLALAAKWEERKKNGKGINQKL